MHACTKVPLPDHPARRQPRLGQFDELHWVMPVDDRLKKDQDLPTLGSEDFYVALIFSLKFQFITGWL